MKRAELKKLWDRKARWACNLVGVGHWQIKTRVASSLADKGEEDYYASCIADQLQSVRLDLNAKLLDETGWPVECFALHEATHVRVYDMLDMLGLKRRVIDEDPKMHKLIDELCDLVALTWLHAKSNL